MNNQSTIAALATPHGASALAIIRMSGTAAFSIVRNFILNQTDFDKEIERRIGFYKFVYNGRSIDYVGIVKYLTPRSYTGENLIEIFCHGGKVIIEQILEALISAGADYAKPGEFTKRAFLNNKLDLIKAESIGQIISSSTIAEHSAAVKNYFGGYLPLIAKWRENAESIFCDIEAIIEFGEEDDIREKELIAGINIKTKKLINEIETELTCAANIKTLSNAIRIAIVGVPNAGKSTLLNLILGYERSIVFHEAGTTRDAVSETMIWHGLQVQFIDSAGIRPNVSGVELLGVQRSWEFIDKCELIIIVTAADQDVHFEEIEMLKRRGKSKSIIGIINKIDLEKEDKKASFFKENSIPFLSCSATNTSKRNEITEFILSWLEKQRPGIEQTSIVSTLRQEEILKKVKQLLLEMAVTGNTPIEILAETAKTVLKTLEEFAGLSTPEELLNSIFSKFCIGK